MATIENPNMVMKINIDKEKNYYRKAYYKFFKKVIGLVSKKHLAIGDALSYGLYNLLIKFKKYTIIETEDGYKMLLDLQDRGLSKDLFFCKCREKESKNIYKRMLKKQKGTVIDIGANIGYYALLAGKYVDKVYAFEPDPRSFKILCENISINKLTNVIPLNYAVSDKERELEFQINLTGYNWSRVIPKNKSNSFATKILRVKALSIDKFCQEEEIDEISIIRTDTEGYEYFILKGMKETIDKHMPSMFLEVHPLAIKGYGGRVDKMLEWLKDYHITFIAKRRFSYWRRTLYPLLGELDKIEVWKVDEKVDRVIKSELREVLQNWESYHLFLEGNL